MIPSQLAMVEDVGDYGGEGGGRDGGVDKATVDCVSGRSSTARRV